MASIARRSFERHFRGAAIFLEFRTLETQVSDSLAQPLLAIVGLYGVTTYSVSRRRSEIGIRMALGAQQRAVIWLMLRGVLALLAAGTALGLAASLAAGSLITTVFERTIRSMLPGQRLLWRLRPPWRRTCPRAGGAARSDDGAPRRVAGSPVRSILAV